MPPKSTFNMQVDIITIGDELLIGQTIDTNSAWMGAELNKIGLTVRQITSISDTEEHIISALDDSLQHADVVLLTGGLGPTKDDVTKYTLAKYFDSPLEVKKDVLERIETYFKKRGIPILEANRLQATLPKKCKVIENKLGTASGMWFEKEGKVIVSMPGVPHEMKYLMSNGVLPALISRFQRPEIIHHTILTCGMGESMIAERISKFELGLSAEEIKLAYLPSLGSVKLRLSATGTDRNQLESKISSKANELKALIPELVFGENNDTLESVVGDLLKERGAFVATAESCTGGEIAARITRVPGASAYFKGSIVAYHEMVKVQILKVPEKIISEHGVVSSQVVEKMAENVAELLHADYAVASTGLAGPDGDGEELPVGTIWLAVYGPGGIKSKCFQFSHNREMNIQRACTVVLDMLRRQILEEGV